MSAAPRLLSHIDLRVRNRARAIDFYDGLLGPLGAIRDDGETFTTYQIPPPDAGDDWEADEWFGLTEDPAMTPCLTRIAFVAPTRGTVDAVAMILGAAGAGDIEGPDEAYGPNYYAVFFSDPDGNRLEVCCIG